MARANTIKFLRTTRANLEAQAAASGLIQGEPYLITDEERPAIGISTSAFWSLALFKEIGDFNTPLRFGTAYDLATVDVDTIQRSGFYQVNNDSSNIPVAAYSYLWVLQHANSAFTTQLVVPATGRPRMFLRNRESGSWWPWEEIDRKKLVTIQSGSVPTPTINTDYTGTHRLTGLTANITSMTTNLSGTPSHGDELYIEFTGTASRTISWGAGFEASTVALPTTTSGTNMLTVHLRYNSATSKWRCCRTW
ncbi:MAG: pyocin knob domain-containing protein [Rhizobiaceae bacterium]|nr:pyocin knob domain-containing protein [Rhizobiaceae bacterium]